MFSTEKLCASQTTGTMQPACTGQSLDLHCWVEASSHDLF
jgi:hypothetical protein